MASPAFAILFSAVVSGVTGSGSAGDVLVQSATTGVFVPSTTANRGTRRSTGVALQAYANNGSVEVQQFGQIDPVTANLGAGTASWVRVSATGGLERCVPAGTDDVCGWVEADGTFHACFGFLTAAIIAGGGGTPTGTGLPHVVLGVQNAAASLVVDADVSATAAIAGTKVSPNFGAQTVITTGSVSVGVTPATVGQIRLPNTFNVSRRNGGDTADETVLASTADTISIGGPAAGTAGQFFSYVNVNPFAGFSVLINGATRLTVDASSISLPAMTVTGAGIGLNAGVPIKLGGAPASTGDIRLSSTGQINFDRGGLNILGLWMDTGTSIGVGSANAASTTIYSGGPVVLGGGGGATVESMLPIIGSGTPHGVHGTVLSSMTDADYLAPAAEYKYAEQVVTAATVLTLTRLYKYPTPATEAASYTKEFVNTAGGAQSITLTRADGAGAGVVVAANTKVTVRVRPGGVYATAAALAAP